METFNLQKALDGHPVTLASGFIVTKITGPTNGVIGGTIEQLDLCQLWYEDGRFLKNKDHPMNLFMKT